MKIGQIIKLVIAILEVIIPFLEKEEDEKPSKNEQK